MAINPKIKQKAEDIRNKIFGSEVRESLASGLEGMSEDVESIKDRQGNVESQFQDVLDETTDKDVISAPELIAARNGKSNLKTRLDDEHAEVTAQLQQTEQELNAQLAQNVTEISEKGIQIDNLFSLRNRVIPLHFSSESNHLGAFSGNLAFDGVRAVSSAGGGWVINVSTKWLEFKMPIGVGIGDSIMEGHSGAHGRLHTLSGVVDLEKINEEGQISFYIEKATNMKFYNHGIGGQTTASIKLRWGRDVLGETNGSLTPTQTLDRKANFVVVCAGINDIFGSSLAQPIIDNLEWMISSCETNKIYGVFYTIGPAQVLTPQQIEEVDKVNIWLKDRAKKSKYITVFDYFTFMNNPSDYGHPKVGYTDAGTHPTKEVYRQIAEKICDENLFDSPIAILPKYINLETNINPSSSFSSLGRPIYIKASFDDIKQVVYLENQSMVSIKVPETKNPIDKIRIEILRGEIPSERPTLNLGNYFISEIYATDKVVTNTGVIGTGDLLDAPIAVGGIPDYRIMLSETVLANADNLPYIYGITYKQFDAQKALVYQGYAVLETIEICNKGDFIMTTASGMGKKVTDLSTQNAIAKSVRYIGVNGSHHLSLVKIL